MIINLHALTVNPLASLHRYNGLMEQCLASGNLKAHFIRGVQRVFSQNNTEREAFHIFITVEGLYNNSIYLYGIIMLCRGKPEIRGFRYTNLIVTCSAMRAFLGSTASFKYIIKYILIIIYNIISTVIK